MKIHATFLILISLLLTSVFHLKAQIPNHYESDIISITGPPNWEMKVEENSWMPVQFYRKVQDNKKFSEFINVSYSNPGEKIEEFTNGLKSQLDQFKVIEESTKKIKNYSVSWLTYSYKYQGMTVKGKVYFFKFPDKVGCLVGYTSLEATYDIFLPLFEKSVETVSFHH